MKTKYIFILISMAFSPVFGSSTVEIPCYNYDIEYRERSSSDETSTLTPPKRCKSPEISPVSRREITLQGFSTDIVRKKIVTLPKPLERKAWK